MTAMQMEMDFRAGSKPAHKETKQRPHNRTTILTTSRAIYAQVCRMLPGDRMIVQAVNDIVSSAKGGDSIEHHMLRRFSLVYRQVKGGYNKVKIRSDAGCAIDCTMISYPQGNEDDCQFSIWIAKPEKAA